MSRLGEIRKRLEAASDEEWGKRWAIRGSEATRFSLARCILEQDIDFVLHAREDVAALLAVVEAELHGRSPTELAKGWGISAQQKYLTNWQRARAARRAEAWKALV